jgi:hypothetical protein
MITSNDLSRALDYRQYRQLIDELLAKGLTTGEKQTPEYLEYTRVNVQRMKRLDNTIQLTEQLKLVLSRLKKKYLWIVITEAWCGDTAQNVPLLRKVEDFCPLISLKLVLRDENPQVMDQYLTNGARSIPKVIALDEHYHELFQWGPRPAPLQAIVKELIAKGGSKEEKGLVTQSWYNKDATFTTQRELSALLLKAEAT